MNENRYRSRRNRDKPGIYGRDGVGTGFRRRCNTGQDTTS